MTRTNISGLSVPITPDVLKVPYGHPKRETIYINDEENNNWISYKFQKRLNRMGLFEIELLGIDSTARNNVAEGNEVMFFIEDQLKFKGKINKVDYETEYNCIVYGYGMEVELTYQQTERTEYTDTATDTIVSAVATATGLTEGTNTNWGDITIRNEHDTYFTLMQNLAEFTGYDFYVSQEYPFDTDKLNFDSRRGSTSSTFTFTTGASSNCYTINRTKEEVINYVVVLGYGDGTNQISTSFYDASATTTTLNETLTDSDTTITLTDANSFSSSGEIIIAEERITYTSKSGNDLTGCTRGANSTTAKAHPTGVYVAKYVDPDSAEAGSSIDTNGVRKKIFVDKTLIDDETAQLYANKILTDYKDSYERIVIRARDFTEPDCTIGDEITVTDTDTGLSGTYRLMGIEWYFDLDVGEVAIYEVSNFRADLGTQIGELNKGTKIPSRYMQGATNCYMSGETDNCDSSKGLTMDFYIPDEAINVNSIKLNYKLSKPRVYGETSAAGQSHSHGLGGVTSGSSDTTEYTNEILTPFEVGNTVDTSSTAEFVAAQIPSAAAGTFDGCVVTVGIFNRSGSNDTYDYEIINLSDGNAQIASASSQSINDSNGSTWNHKFETTDVSSGDSIKFNVSNGIVGTGAGKIREGYIYIKIQTNATHDHSFTGETTDSESSHTHDITYAIGEKTYGASDIVVKVDGVDKTSDIETEKGSALNATENSTENGSHMELKDYLSGTIAGAWHTVTIEPDGDCRVKSDLYIQIFIESE